MRIRTQKITKKRQQVTLEPEDIAIVDERRARDGNSSQTAAVRAIIRDYKRFDAAIKDGQLVWVK